VFFFQLFDHGLQELELAAFFDDFGFDFDGHLFFDSAFVHFVARNLSKKLEGLNPSSLQTLVFELVAKVKLTVFAGFVLGPSADVSKDKSLLSFLTPFVDPVEDDTFVTVVLRRVRGGRDLPFVLACGP